MPLVVMVFTFLFAVVFVVFVCTTVPPPELLYTLNAAPVEVTAQPEVPKFQPVNTYPGRVGIKYV